jgi:hypothetical protein
MVDHSGEKLGKAEIGTKPGGVSRLHHRIAKNGEQDGLED